MLKNVPEGVATVYLQEFAIEEVLDVLSRTHTETLEKAGTVKCEIWLSVEEGNEIALSNDFPQPILLEKLRRIIHGFKLGDVSVHLHSWQDPAYELEQSAWCIVVKL